MKRSVSILMFLIAIFTGFQNLNAQTQSHLIAEAHLPQYGPDGGHKDSIFYTYNSQNKLESRNVYWEDTIKGFAIQLGMDSFHYSGSRTSISTYYYQIDSVKLTSWITGANITVTDSSSPYKNVISQGYDTTRHVCYNTGHFETIFNPNDTSLEMTRYSRDSTKGQYIPVTFFKRYVGPHKYNFFSYGAKWDATNNTWIEVYSVTPHKDSGFSYGFIQKSNGVNVRKSQSKNFPMDSLNVNYSYTWNGSAWYYNSKDSGGTTLDTSNNTKIWFWYSWSDALKKYDWGHREILRLRGKDTLYFNYDDSGSTQKWLSTYNVDVNIYDKGGNLLSRGNSDTFSYVHGNKLYRHVLYVDKYDSYSGKKYHAKQRLDSFYYDSSTYLLKRRKIYTCLYWDPWEYTSYLGYSYDASSRLVHIWQYSRYDSKSPMRDDRYYYNVITGIDKGKSDDERIAVYPNPSGDIFHFRIGNFTDKNQMLFIYDMAGRVIFTAKFKENSSLWDASKNAPGIYFYKIISGNDSQSGKMILSR